MMKRRFFVAIAVLAVILGGAGGGAFAQNLGKFTDEQYKKALWMVTRFYGAQRSGYGPNWLLMDHPYKVSFVRDSSDGSDLVGGWFDCGDHVLFGNTFFYSAYMLAKAYETFPTGFHDLYDGTNYSDYAASGDWSIAGGSPNGIPDLLEELKYATDWIIKATPNGTTFYYQKGNGGTGDGGDHSLWVTSGYKSLQPKSKGGESDQPRSICKNPEDVTMASFAAGALAVMSKIYRKYDADYAAICSTHAVNAYAYASLKKGKTAGTCFGGFYSATETSKAPVFLHIGAAEMYNLTGDSKYRSDMSTAPITRNWAFDYVNPHDIAAYLSAAMANGADKQTMIDNLRTSYVQVYSTEAGSNSEGISQTGGTWGAMRYVANHAFTAALYSKIADAANYDQFIYNQVDYILGKNSRNYSFLVGFDEHGGETAKKPHHRNVFLNDENVEVKNTLNIPPRNKYFGYMVGGHRNPNSYNDNVDDFESTEGGLDYQAGFVGVLAYIVSKLAPADTAAFGQAPPVPKTLRISLSADPSAEHPDTLVIALGASPALHAYIFDESGAPISSGINCGDVTWKLNGDSEIWKSGCTATYPDTAAQISSITVSYPVAGPQRYISATIPVRAATSVSYLAGTLSNRGYAMTVKPQSVTFTAAPGREITSLGIYNIQGKRIFSKSGSHKEITYTRTNIPRGLYLVKLTLNNGAAVQRNLILK